MFLESRRTDTEGFPTGKLSILLRNSCVVLHEMIFFRKLIFCILFVSIRNQFCTKLRIHSK